MAKTFADMTPQERLECIGMWARIEGVSGPCIITGVVESGAARFTCPSEAERPYYGEPLDPSIVLTGLAVPEIVTPRPDLPRAWTPDGAPVSGEWEEGGYFDFTPGASPLPIQGRRWISDWEPVEGGDHWIQ